MNSLSTEAGLFAIMSRNRFSQPSKLLISSLSTGVGLFAVNTRNHFIQPSKRFISNLSIGVGLTSEAEDCMGESRPRKVVCRFPIITSVPAGPKQLLLLQK